MRITTGDLLAGASVALILVPQSVAYAELAGLPPHVGLHAAALPALAAAPFGSSPYLQTGPVAVTSLLTLGALVPLAPVGTAEYVGFAALLALIVGVTRLLLGLLRAGVVAYLMSEPLLAGFTLGAALLIIASQLPGALGIEPPPAGVLPAAIWAIRNVDLWAPTAVVLSLVTIALVLGGRGVHPLMPGTLIATLIGLGVGVSGWSPAPTVGAVPTGLPEVSLGLPWGALPRLFLPGFIIALIGFAEPASIARMHAAQDRTFWNPHREFLGQGVANITAGLSGGFPVGGSFSRSSLNQLAGARTRWSGAVTGLAVLAFLPFAWVLAPLPKAVLSAIVIASVAGLVRVRPLVEFWQLSKPQFLVASITFAMTLALAPHVEQAVIVGVLLSAAIHFTRELHLDVRSWAVGETLHFEPRGVLWFGSAPAVQEAFVKHLAQHPGVKKVVLHMGGLGRVDVTGALALRQLLTDARRAGLDTRLENVPPHAERILSRTLGWKRPAAEDEEERTA